MTKQEARLIAQREAIRFRRLDAYNYVIERARVVGAAFDAGPKKGQPNPRAGETVWEIESYHSRLDRMVKAALDSGVGGDSVKELGESLKASTKAVLDAISEAVASGGLSMHAYNEKKAETTAKAKATRKLNESASTKGGEK